MFEKVGLIAGKGQFPLLFAQAAKRRGVAVMAVAHRGETDPRLEALVDRLNWVYVGQLGKIIRLLKAAGVRQAVMAGGISRGRLFSQFRPDLKALSLIRRVGGGRDDRLLRAVAAELEAEGIAIVPSTLFLDDLLATKGVLSRRPPTPEEVLDLEFGFQVAKEIGRLDLGQCVVVRRQVVVAVETVEGTDETIRRGGRLAGPGTVVVKVSKPDQDLRFDVPAVGRDTLAVMREVKAAVLGVEAGKTLIFDQDEVLKLANQAKIAVVGLEAASVPA